MAAKDPERRRLAAQVAVNMQMARLSPAERTARTAKARAAYLEQLRDEIDPERKLDPTDLEVRVRSLRKAKLAAMSIKAAAARRAKRDAQAAAELDELLAAEGAA